MIRPQLALVAALAWLAASLPARADEPQLPPPVGVTVRPGISSLQLAWSRGPGTSAPLVGFAVYVWPTARGFTAYTRHACDDASLTVKDLQPDLDYTVAVAAATKLPLPGTRLRIGEWTLSPLSTPASARTLPDTELRLLTGRLEPATAVFELQKYDIARDVWHRTTVSVRPGDRVGGRSESAAVDFATPWTLKSLRLREHRAPLEPREWPLPGPDGQPRKDPDGAPYTLPLPVRAPPQLVLCATLTALPDSPAPPDAALRERLLFEGQ